MAEFGASEKASHDYAAGVAAGIATVLIGHPFDTIKVCAPHFPSSRSPSRSPCPFISSADPTGSRHLLPDSMAVSLRSVAPCLPPSFPFRNVRRWRPRAQAQP